MLFNSERENYDMDITEYFLAILLLLLPIFAFTSGKIILQRQENVKKTGNSTETFGTFGYFP